MASSDICITCNLPVGARQEGVQCDGCLLWNHRTCNTGITRPEYRKAVKEGNGIEWRYRGCFEYDVLPQLESTRIDESKFGFVDMLCYVMLCYAVTLYYGMLCYVCYVILLCLLCYVMLCYVMLCYAVTLYYGMLCYVCYVMLCYVMLCYVMLCYVMLCYVMLLCCYVMLCYVMLCYVMFYVMLCSNQYSLLFVQADFTAETPSHSLGPSFRDFQDEPMVSRLLFTIPL